MFQGEKQLEQKTLAEREHVVHVVCRSHGLIIESIENGLSLERSAKTELDYCGCGVKNNLNWEVRIGRHLVQ